MSLWRGPGELRLCPFIAWLQTVRTFGRSASNDVQNCGDVWYIISTRRSVGCGGRHESRLSGQFYPAVAVSVRVHWNVTKLAGA
jgi:hypothetical protein